MAELPAEFREQYDQKGDTFETIAEIVLTSHGRQFTADDIAARVEPEREAVRQHLKTLEDDGWIDGADGPKRYTWNTQYHNPAEQQAIEAVGSVTDDALALASRATNSVPEFFAVVAILGVVTGMVSGVTAVVAILLPVGTGTPLSYAAIGGGYALGGLLTLGLVWLAVQWTRRQS
ncbi:hypothetical protein NDI56_21470 [Haloarcula sp. S1CR25-12]|jgi:DNA-binding IclR family transcriptional regulator|uniref:ArsR family transcriptional regulator n=1 Tax=Haloarcula saliterrae TaxID=2950534 RepID=A0ABU2FJQ3_9EURY|nr:hypothetical protein [Haloarcula sp. S1CR25-12]MDS0261981.1 hypothetical protein [Haloarcula sp. S1CR25-12]